MANHLSAFHGSTALQALTVFSVLSVLVADHVEGRHHRHCPSFSCGPLGNVSSPFRRAGDPPGCGYRSYQLVCSDTKATIRIGNATYNVSGINYTDSTFWVVDTSLDSYNSCPLPRWNIPRPLYGRPRHSIEVELDSAAYSEANFVNCSQEVENNGMYMPVSCQSTNYSFVYVLTGPGSSSIESLEPSCRYLAMTPLGTAAIENASYADVVKSMRGGFAVEFPFKYPRIVSINDCLMESTIFLVYLDKTTKVYCWFVLVPLAIFIFLAHKYWKTRITIDAVEKFLRMQQMIGPTRYAYTDIVAITCHFRDKLGQGGYGSVFKGVLLPGHVHVAVKMLEGNSNCNGEDFISEVSTIGSIHHINVVRLVGFCSEQMRRALVYEYMSRGSLDKYIFSADKSFSWDKLNEIALGIARGINYLHQGCQMQILHFDIKPHNILLDDNFVPKVADFGLAKLYPRDTSFVPLSALRGTIGYIAPEMISRSFGVISNKSDVYSFGMLLLEMAGGRKNADPNTANSNQAYYPSWVYDRLTEQEVGDISAAAEMHELERKLCLVGLCCIQMKSHDRPMMSEVIEMLEGGVDGLHVPSRPFFCDDEHTPVADSYYFCSELTAISEEEMED